MFNVNKITEITRLFRYVLVVYVLLLFMRTEAWKVVKIGKRHLQIFK